MDRKKAIGLIQKLEKLAGDSANAEETALAAATMQRLIAKHKISKAELEATPLEAESFILYKGKFRFQRWKIQLASGIASANSCVLLVNSVDVELILIGVSENTKIVSYMFKYLMNEIERLATNYIELRRVSLLKSTRATSNSFKLGCVDGIKSRLMKAKYDTLDGESKALVLVKREKEVAEKLADLLSGNGKVDIGSSRNDATAYRSGIRASENVNLDNSGKGELG
jgi:hypothetical protein